MRKEDRLAWAFRDELKSLEWTNGRNARLEYRWVTSEIDRPALRRMSSRRFNYGCHLQ